MPLIPRDRELGWTPYAWLVYAVPFAVTPAINGWGVRQWLTHAAGLVVFLALYFRGQWARGGELLLIITGLALLGVVFWPASLGAGAFFIYAAGFAGQFQRPATGVRVIAAIAVVVIAEAWLGKVSIVSASWPLVFTILVGAINMHFWQVGRANARLRLAHDEIEHLAKVAERERIARDLHDLLGHTLSLIVLKSELASKLAERDVERARSEIRDVERISREALAEVRAAVSGYRAGGLKDELESARLALDTAGVALETDVDPAPLPPAHEAVIALAMREAVTNVVRHSGARKCRIALRVDAAACTLVVSDDGRGGTQPFGSGLAGMQERVELVGGTFVRDGTRGTTLTITLPIQQALQQETA